MGFRFRGVHEVLTQSCVVPDGTLVCCLSGGPTVETVGYCRVSQGDRKPFTLTNRRFGDPSVLMSSIRNGLFVFRFLGLCQVLKQFFEIVPFAECVEVGVRLHVLDVVVTRLDRLVQPPHRQICLFLGETIAVRRRSLD